jgi:hypothetical protein
VYATYEGVGRELEDAYRLAAQGSTPATPAGLGERLAGLDELAYQFNIMMLAQLRSGTVGRRAPDPLEPTVTGPAPPRS